MNDRQLDVTTTTIESMGAGPPSRQPGPPSNAAAMKVALQPEITGQSALARPFEPATVRCIKLGQNGKWATDALEEGIIPFGYSAVDHHARLAGEWDRVRDQLVAMGRTANGVSQGLRELKDFYDLPDDTLWVTMADWHFWWAFAEGPVVVVEPGNPDKPARYRRTRAGRSKTSLAGEPITVRSLSSA